MFLCLVFFFCKKKILISIINNFNNFAGKDKKKSILKSKMDFKNFNYNYNFRFITFSAAAIIALLFNLYLSINCSGVPLSPKESLTATNS